MSEANPPAVKNYSSINKLMSTLLMVGLLISIIVLSWFASPDPILDVLTRSLPIIVLVASLMAMTISGSSLVLRIMVFIFQIVGSILLAFVFINPFWAAAYIVVALSVLFDLLITIQGCKSPLVLNSNENFVIFVLLFGASFGIGFFFEFINSAFTHIWDITAMISFYPILSVFGVNLLVVFNWSIIGVLLFECMLFAIIVGRKRNVGASKSCSFE